MRNKGSRFCLMIASTLSALYVALQVQIWCRWKDLPKYENGKKLSSINDRQQSARGLNGKFDSDEATLFANLTEVLGGSRSSLMPPKMAEESEWLLPATPHPDAATSIPQIIHKVYFQSDGQFQSIDAMHVNLRAAHESWLKMNEGYQLKYYNLRHARMYLRQHFNPVFLRAFDCIQAYSGKADFFRYALIYREGGFYSDWKQVCMKQGLLDLISKDKTFWAARDRPNPCINFQTSFFGAIPRHRILAKTLEKLLGNVKTKEYGRKPWAATGPCVFGAAITEIGYNESSIGAFRGNNRFKLTLTSDENIVMHKCKGCGSDQNWSGGNNYWDLWNERRFYCEDAPLIFDQE